MSPTPTARPQNAGASPAPEPLRILHVDTERAWGGGQAQLVELSRYLARRGHQQLVACRPDGVLRSVLQPQGIAVADLRARNDVDLRAVWQLRRLLAAGRYDVVHYHTARAHALAPWLPRPRGTRVVVSRLMDYRPHVALRVRYLYNRCVDGVIAISEAIAGVLRDAGVNSRRIRVIYLGIDGERFAHAGSRRPALRDAWGVGPDDLVVITAAVLVPRKGHAVLLDALARLRADGVALHWVICGDGPSRADIESRVSERGLRKHVTFTGFSSAVETLLPGADVFVLPSLHEGLGIAAMEAMAAELPVIASRVGGLPEIVVDGETGLLVPAGDATALADAIRRVAADPTWARLAGQRGCARVRAHFTSAAMVEAIEAYYYELLRRS